MFDRFKKRVKESFPEDETPSVIRKDELEDKVRNILLEADVSYDSAGKIVEMFRDRLGKVKKKIDYQLVLEELKETIREVLSAQDSDLDFLSPGKSPYVVLFLGINGTGKTTTVAKLATYVKKNGKRVVLAASDTFRAGAIEQLTQLGENIGVNVIKHVAKSDPSSVAYDAIEHARARNLDYVLIDSAGRMQTNRNLIDEMKKIKRVSKPDLTVLVLDSMIGQDAVHQAETFMKETPFDGIILTKLDTDARGGAIITIALELEKPIYFVGIGQKMDDIIPFDVEWYLDKIIP
ncbi:cell division protein FtsY [uncultured archaeon]|nr:cell division protein FtsY [uncultured archaeon]